jgi:hypothetical protein
MVVVEYIMKYTEIIQLTHIKLSNFFINIIYAAFLPFTLFFFKKKKVKYWNYG